MRANGKVDHTVQLDPQVVAWLRVWSKRTRRTQGGLIDSLVRRFMKRLMAKQLPPFLRTR